MPLARPLMAWNWMVCLPVSGQNWMIVSPHSAFHRAQPTPCRLIILLFPMSFLSWLTTTGSAKQRGRHYCNIQLVESKWLSVACGLRSPANQSLCQFCRSWWPSCSHAKYWTFVAHRPRRYSMLQMLLAGADGVQSCTDLLACADAAFKKYGRKVNLIQKWKAEMH